MQSSYNLIKNNAAKQGDNKVISTVYVKKKPIEEEIIEEVKEEEQEPVIKAPAIDPEELLKRYEDIGQRIIQDAKNEKQVITLRAQIDAEAAERSAYKKGYEQGLQNGYDDGYQKAYNETIESAKAEADEIISKAENILKSAHDNYIEYLEAKKAQIIKLAVDMAESITRKELSKDDSLNVIIEEAFSISKGEDSVIIKANSIHVDEIKSQIDIWKISYGIKNDIFIISDDFMEPGNAIIEKPSGLVKVGVDIGMEQIRKTLFN